MKPLEVFLGVLTAVGGFVDVTELVFMSQAGSRFQYSLIWVIVLATIGIMVFGEMSGRVAAMSHQPLFGTIRHRLGFSLGGLTLVGALISTLITCAAEIGGVALVLQLLTGWNYALLAVLAAGAFVATIYFLPFKWIERTYGLLGLFMLVFGAALIAFDPPWHDIAAGAIPQGPPRSGWHDQVGYAYFAVALISAIMFPYELYFYSSGAIEDGWSGADIATNRITTFVGFGLGSLLAIAILCLGALEFGPRGISPDMIGTVVTNPGMAYGKLGVLLGLLGLLFAIGGAAIETCLSCAYGVSQFFGWRWGRHVSPKETPLFTAAWMVVFALALGIVLTGIQPTELADYAIVTSIVVLPLSFLPLLLVARDRNFMRDHANGVLANVLGWGYYAVIVVAALLAIPLYLLTSGGKI
ncbi:MAG: NRAMP family divalent metal transporter [Tsuneonella sp.]